ncbi:twin-arginine translocase TatA/TatE family subunit [Flavobacterium sp.]|uniref:Sec-independent protein translocase subunit TatA/TatB n=1 Tax=Flavobacterium sp. TaxID=239 RepID=UPI0025BB9B51|nr:twin-arginine translocase TatA/TatE family subunit [Flavobacterium sp.]MBA4152966.1 Sec-independent protein translocase TatA [Flavobacterium sp.]
MFGIGGGEFILIIFVVLMLFGSDKIPDIARTLGKMMRQLKHATDDIKSEIQKSADANGLDAQNLSSGISQEIQKVKQDFNDIVKPTDLDTAFKTEIEKTKEDIEQITGPIKRQL